MLESLIEQAVDEDDLANVAAGPLEAYLSDDESTLDWVERQAANSAKLKRALAGIHVDRLSDRAFARIERAAGSVLQRAIRPGSLRAPDRPPFEAAHRGSPSGSPEREPEGFYRPNGANLTVYPVQPPSP